MTYQFYITYKFYIQHAILFYLDNYNLIYSKSNNNLQIVLFLI